MKCWDSVLSDIQELFNQQVQDSVCYAVSDWRITECVILSLEECFNWDFQLRLLWKLSSKFSQKLSESSASQHTDIYWDYLKVRSKCTYICSLSEYFEDTTIILQWRTINNASFH